MKKIFLSILIFLGILCLSNIVATSSFNRDLNFEFNNVNYCLDLEELASNQNINLEDYPYYFIGDVIEKDSSGLTLFYSKERISLEKNETDTTVYYYIRGGEETLEFVIEADGSIQEGKIVDFKKSNVVIENKGFVVSNHNIYCDEEVIFSKNCDCEYEKIEEETQSNLVESEESTDEIEITDVNKITSDGLEITEKENDVKKIEFPYNDTMYTVELSSSSLGVNLDEYEYYFVKKVDLTELELYYSKTRLTAHNFWISYGENTILVKLGLNGTVRKSIVGQTSVYVPRDRYIASNQNIYDINTLAYNRNCGYEYDETQEKGEECDEIVKTKNAINIYQKAAVNYDIVATMTEGSAVKRIKKGVNEVNGHVWDKIELSNGKVAYVFSDELEIATDTKTLKFQYKDNTYTVYLSSSSLGVNLDEYEYYFVKKVDETEFELYCSKARLTAHNFWITYGENTIRVTMGVNGTLKRGIASQTSAYVPKDKYIASNQNIYDINTLAYNRNCGYEYDETQEKGEECNEIVKTKNAINIYQKAAVNYDIVATMTEGSAVKRIKKGVNEVNGHVWDKIELSNGKVAYVFSDELEIATDTKTLQFQYKDNIYTVYLSSSSLGVNLDEYEYYFVKEVDGTELELYYSKTRLTARSFWISYGENTIRVTMGVNGTLKKGIADQSSVYTPKEKYVASNQDIYDVNNIVFYECVHDEIKNISYKKNLNWDEISPSKSNYDEIKRKEELYNSMSALEASQLNKDLISWWSIAWAGATAAKDTYENASSALLYFLTEGEDGKTDNTFSYEKDIFTAGHTMREISLNDAIGDSSEMNAQLSQTMNSVINGAELFQSVNDNNSVVFSNIIEDSATVSKESSMDWHLAINNYRIKSESTFSKIGTSYTLKLRYGIIDYYDWNKGNNQSAVELNEILGVVADHMYDLHRAGRARNYTNYGEISYIIKWEKGQRIGTGVFGPQILKCD